MQIKKLHNHKNNKLQRSLLDQGRHALDDRILTVLLRMEASLHVHPEESTECLPEAGSERSQKSLDDAVG